VQREQRQSQTHHTVSPAGRSPSSAQPASSRLYFSFAMRTIISKNSSNSSTLSAPATLRQGHHAFSGPSHARRLTQSMFTRSHPAPPMFTFCEQCVSCTDYRLGSNAALFTTSFHNHAHAMHAEVSIVPRTAKLPKATRGVAHYCATHTHTHTCAHTSCARTSHVMVCVRNGTCVSVCVTACVLAQW
jgi:hypothetical protein